MTVDIFHALKKLTISIRRVLATNFIKDEKKKKEISWKLFYTFLKICCSYFNNLQQQINSEHRINIESMKELLSSAFPLFDAQEIFGFET